LKYLSGLLVFLVSASVFAGDYYYEPNINTYDPVTGLYYTAVEGASTKGGFLSSTASRSVVNIAIYDPAKETYTLLFKESQKDSISIVLFETGFKDGSIEFNGETSSALVLNNIRVAKREPRDKLLVGVQNIELKQTDLYVSDKKGNHLKKLVTIPFAADWHIDVKNSKLRVVHQTGKGIRIENYTW
jgi:hypothetical protein